MKGEPKREIRLYCMVGCLVSVEMSGNIENDIILDPRVIQGLITRQWREHSCLIVVILSLP